MAIFWLVDGVLYRDLSSPPKGAVVEEFLQAPFEQQPIGEQRVERIPGAVDEAAPAPMAPTMPEPAAAQDEFVLSDAAGIGILPVNSEVVAPPAQRPPSVSPAPHYELAPTAYAEPSGTRQQGTSPRARVHLVPVSQVMSHPVVSLGVEASVGEALAVFRQRGYHHLPVVDREGRLAGVLSDRDLLRNPGASGPVADHMTRRVLTACSTTEIRDAAGAMMAGKISCLPVIDDERLPIGIVTVANLLGYLVDQPAMRLWD